MSDRNIPRHEIQASNELDATIAKKLPAILEKLPADVTRQVTDSVYELVGSPAWKVPAELIRRRKYELLVHHGHIPAFTAEEIADANKKDIKEESVWTSNGVGPDDAGMVV